MPFYRCTVPDGLINPEQRVEIAQRFTRIHSTLTGAPASFVHVHFVDLEVSAASDAESCEIHGTIRAGRSADVTIRLVGEMKDTFSEIAEVASAKITMGLTEVPASWIMEAGEISPEPGSEAKWLDRHSSPPHN